MNLFVTDKCPIKCAQYLDDKRVVKMVLETAQLLSTALRLNGYEGSDVYRATHVNHPATKWVAETKQNYLWTLRHFTALSVEYSKRYGKIHKCYHMYPAFLVLSDYLKEAEMTPFVNCAANGSLGISYKHINCVFTAYQLYLNDRVRS